MLLRLDNLIFAKLVWLWMVHHFHLKTKSGTWFLFRLLAKITWCLYSLRTELFCITELNMFLLQGNWTISRQGDEHDWPGEQSGDHSHIPYCLSRKARGGPPLNQQLPVLLLCWEPYPLWNRADLWTSDVLNKQSAFSTVSCHVISGCLLLDHHCEVWHE